MKKVFSYLTLGIILLLLAMQVSCVAAAGTNATELDVFAAASLTGAIVDLNKVFEAAHPGVHVMTNFDSSGTLETQIKEGAPADLFLPASDQNIQNLVKAKLLDNSSVTPYATNKLAVIVPVDNPKGITGLADLGKTGVKIVSEVSTVPVRKYTEQMLTKLSNDVDYGPVFVKRFKRNIISEETNVAGATSKVALGAADAGVTYFSDVTKGLADQINVIEIPDKYNVVASYSAGIISESPHKDLAKEYIDLLKSEQGKTTLKDYKFSTV